MLSLTNWGRSPCASPGSCSLTPQGTPALVSAKGINTPPPLPLQYRTVGGAGGGAGPQRPVSLTRGRSHQKACESLAR